MSGPIDFNQDVTPHYTNDIIETLRREQQHRDAGFTIIKDAPNTLLLDIDAPSFVLNQQLFALIDLKWGVFTIEQWESKSGNVHVRVVLRSDLPTPMRIGLQAALGSDPIREALMLELWSNGMEEPSMLYRPAGAVVQRIYPNDVNKDTSKLTHQLSRHLRNRLKQT